MSAWAGGWATPGRPAAIAVQGKAVDDPPLDIINLDRQWQVNVLGTVAGTRAAAPVLADITVDDGVRQSFCDKLERRRTVAFKESDQAKLPGGSRGAGSLPEFLG